jgi:hypothetical protein
MHEQRRSSCICVLTLLHPHAPFLAGVCIGAVGYGFRCDAPRCAALHDVASAIPFARSASSGGRFVHPSRSSCMGVPVLVRSSPAPHCVKCPAGASQVVGRLCLNWRVSRVSAIRTFAPNRLQKNRLSEGSGSRDGGVCLMLPEQFGEIIVGPAAPAGRGRGMGRPYAARNLAEQAGRARHNPGRGGHTYLNPPARAASVLAAAVHWPGSRGPAPSGEMADSLGCDAETGEGVSG